MENINKEILQLMLDYGIITANLSWTSRLLIIALMLLIVLIVNVVFKRVVIPMVEKITIATKAKWDDYIFSPKMLRAFCRVIDPILIYVMLPAAFGDMPSLLTALSKICTIYTIVVTLLLINTFLNTLSDMQNENERLRDRPLKGVFQMVKLIAASIGIIAAIAILMDSDLTSIMAGLGASAAVLMLIFKDSIMGLVAGVQLSAYDVLRPGDWITVPKYGADGYVEEVSLTIVKVRNFDKTIVTIPPYSLISESFQNWRGMWDTGARRIKRSIYIDVDSVRFCTPQEIERGQEMGLIPADEPAGQVENLKLYRLYLTHYLLHHPRLNTEMLTMVRQLQPTPEGVPLEIYCFTDTTVWTEYEGIQADIFDHILAVTPSFGLRVFQRISAQTVRN